MTANMGDDAIIVFGPSVTLAKSWVVSDLPHGVSCGNEVALQGPLPSAGSDAARGRTSESAPPSDRTIVLHAVSDPARSKHSNESSKGLVSSTSDQETERPRPVHPTESIIHRAAATFEELETNGPTTFMRKVWDTAPPDTMFDLVSVCELETDRERRRKHPEVPLHITRAKFMRDIGLTDDDLKPPPCAESSDGAQAHSSIFVVDDANRAYYGHPEDAAWRAFFTRIGRPLEDFQWLKTTVFVTDETHEELQIAAAVEASEATRCDGTETVAPMSSAAPIGSSNPYPLDHVINLQPDPAGAGSSPLRCIEKSPRRQLLASYRSVHPRPAELSFYYSNDGITGYGEASAASTTSLSPIVPLFSGTPGGDVQLALTATDTTTATRRRLDESYETAGGGAAALAGVSPMGSYEPSKCTGLSEYTPTRPAPSRYTSLPITERYSRTHAAALTSSEVSPQVPTPPIKSGREYRNEMHRNFLERKEKGIASTPAAHARTPHRPLHQPLKSQTEQPPTNELLAA